MKKNPKKLKQYYNDKYIPDIYNETSISKWEMGTIGCLTDEWNYARNDTSNSSNYKEHQ